MSELTTKVSTRPISAWFTVLDALGISAIDLLYNRLDGAYPHWWAVNFSTPQAIENWKESWVEAFEDEGVTPAMVKAGLKVCRSRYTSPPSCAQFIQACKPSIDYTVAYYEAIAGLQERGKGEMGQWSHRAVYWAAALLKQDLGMQTHAAIKSRWEAALKAQFERTEWPEIPQPRLELAAPGDGKLSKEEAKRMVKQLGADGIIKNVNDAGGHLRWATKIIDRVAAGSCVPSASIKAAQEALGKLANNPEQDIAESQKVG